MSNTIPKKKTTIKKKAIKNSNKKISSAASIEHHIGNIIRNQRNLNHLTINEVSELAAISPGMLSRIERGDVSASLETLEKLAIALGMPISLFFRDYDVPEGSAQLVRKGKLPFEKSDDFSFNAYFFRRSRADCLKIGGLSPPFIGALPKPVVVSFEIFFRMGLQSLESADSEKFISVGLVSI